MALPKEPRQKMINLMYLVLTALLAMNVSSEILNAFKVVDKSLITSNTNLTNGNKTIYESLAAKLADPQSAEKAKIWVPKAEQAKKLSDDLNTYLENLKHELKVGSGLTQVDGKESFKEDNLDAADHLFDTQKKGEELEKKLLDYRNAMIAIDPAIYAKFAKTLPIDTVPPTAQDGSKKPFTQAYFHMTPTVAALTLLSKFQNNVKNAENQVVTYCHEQIGAVKLIFNKFQPIAGASATYLMPGQEMTIQAGVGAFNDAAKPVISINGASTPLNENGVAEKKFNVSGTGNQKVHVSITYTKPDGTPDHLEKDIDYTVGVPGGAAVMLDKMNVFYIGVPNPITISSGSGWDKTTVSMSGGNLSGSGSNRTVTVSTPGKATITVTADGKSSTFDFRVKEIPNPVFKVGPGGTRMTAGSFKNQQYCRAELENFDFAATFDVVSAKVYFSGAGFSSVQAGVINGNNLAALSGLMSRCGPGSAITFDEVKVKGPDGKQRNIQGVGIVLY